MRAFGHIPGDGIFDGIVQLERPGGIGPEFVIPMVIEIVLKMPAMINWRGMPDIFNPLLAIMQQRVGIGFDIKRIPHMDGVGRRLGK